MTRPQYRAQGGVVVVGDEAADPIASATQRVAAELFAPVCSKCGKPRMRRVPPDGVQWRCRRCGAAYREGLTPPALPELVVPAHLRPTTSPDVFFPKLCFRKAYEYVRDHPREGGLRLCHGQWRVGDYRQFGGRDLAQHAWVEVGAHIAFDPNWQRFYAREEYYRARDIVPEVRYTYREAFTLHCATEHFGPWPRL